LFVKEIAYQRKTMQSANINKLTEV